MSFNHFGYKANSCVASVVSLLENLVHLLKSLAVSLIDCYSTIS